MDLQSSTRENTQLFQGLFSILCECFSGEGLADLELGVWVFETKVLIRQSSDVIVENADLFSFEEAASEALAATLRPKYDFSHVWATCIRFGWHAFLAPLCSLFPFKLDGLI